MYDFSQEQDQKTRAQGPIPAGSSVLVRLTLRQPKYPANGQELVGVTQSGMFFFDAQYEVIAGTYVGLKIWEWLFLPAGKQETAMSDNQRMACNIAGSKMKGMLCAARGVSPKDDSPQAKRKLAVGSWLELSGLEFPIVVGIAKEQTEGKDGKLYWNNTVSRIVTPEAPTFKSLMAGGENITDGPVTGSGSKSNGRGNPANEYGDPGYDRPPADAYDDVPF